MSLELVPMHINKVVRFSFIESPVRDVHNLLKNKTFKDALNGYDPAVISDMLEPWLERTARQRVSTPSDGKLGGPAVDNFFRGIRRRSSQSIMFLSVVNALQQFTGIAVAAIKVKPTYLMRGMYAYLQNPKEFGQMISDKDDYMLTRNTTSVIEQLKEVEKIVINPSPTQKVRDFADAHALFLQLATQNMVDNIVWWGAYNQGIAEMGMDEKAAVMYAASVVRETQGGFEPESISKAEASTPFTRVFITFYGYFNMLANTLGSEFSIAMRTMSGQAKLGRMLYIYAMGMVVPAVVAEAISISLRGNWDEDDDDEYLDDFAEMFFGSQVRTAAMVPGAGSFGMSLYNKFNDKWYDDRVSLSPALGQLERGLKAGYSVPKAVFGDGKSSTATKDSLALINLFFGVPTGQLGKTGGFLIDVAEDEQEVEDAVDLTRGLLGGRADTR